ncbi:hypothetical protein KUTeg_001497 [Tegillarca granosa]|uniref:Uncharacterized protein n=1 Tax=Tegillarca granosa TaxID=220873 RepID=A0ABQ9FRP9_TEGGR|nr:hypothetical protein KUTeg_001497 [Tegillarca granosa]
MCKSFLGILFSFFNYLTTIFTVNHTITQHVCVFMIFLFSLFFFFLIKIFNLKLRKFFSHMIFLKKRFRCLLNCFRFVRIYFFSLSTIKFFYFMERLYDMNFFLPFLCHLRKHIRDTRV